MAQPGQRTAFGARGSSVRIRPHRPSSSECSAEVAHWLGKLGVPGSNPGVPTTSTGRLDIDQSASNVNCRGCGIAAGPLVWGSLGFKSRPRLQQQQRRRLVVGPTFRSGHGTVRHRPPAPFQVFRRSITSLRTCHLSSERPGLLIPLGLTFIVGASPTTFTKIYSLVRVWCKGSHAVFRWPCRCDVRVRVSPSAPNSEKAAFLGCFFFASKI